MKGEFRVILTYPNKQGHNVTCSSEDPREHDEAWWHIMDVLQTLKEWKVISPEDYKKLELKLQFKPHAEWVDERG